MKTHVGGLDRIVRILAGIVLLAWTLMGAIGAGAGLAWCRWQPACSESARCTPSSG